MIIRFLYIITYNISCIYITYIIFTAACTMKTQNKIKIDNNRVKYIKYNYISNTDTGWNHGEVAWDIQPKYLSIRQKKYTENYTIIQRLII